MSDYPSDKPLVARAPAQATPENLYRPGAAGSAEGRRRSGSDTAVVSALTVAATTILLYDLILFVLNV
jgi:hypothetical protein